MKKTVFETIQRHSPEFGRWIKEKEDKIGNAFTFKEFYLAFSMASRIPGGEVAVSGTMALSSADKIVMDQWMLNRLGRVYLLMVLSESDGATFEKVYQQLFETAELKELIALYTALPFLPDPEKYVERAAEGIRTNIAPVFEAVALGNPYPAKYLPEIQWNQLVLKAVFTAKPLYRISGIDARANQDLAVMLVNYAKERWSAGRSVTPELWRTVARFLRPEDEPLLRKMLEDKDPLQKEAAVLAYSESGLAVAEKINIQHPAIYEKIMNKELTWDSLGIAYEKLK